MAVITTYDVPSKHVELKNALFAKGYTDYVPHYDQNGKAKKIYLPNTTVYHSTKTSKQATDDIEAICSQLRIKLERCVATIWKDWSAIWGEPFGS